MKILRFFGSRTGACFEQVNTVQRTRVSVCVCIYLTSGGHVLKTRVLGSPELGKRRRGGPKAPLGELSS